MESLQSLSSRSTFTLRKVFSCSDTPILHPTQCRTYPTKANVRLPTTKGLRADKIRKIEGYIQRESEESGTPSMGRRTSRVRSKIKQQDSYLLGGRAGSFPVSEHLGRTRARGLNSMIHFLYIRKKSVKKNRRA